MACINCWRVERGLGLGTEFCSGVEKNRKCRTREAQSRRAGVVGDLVKLCYTPSDTLHHKTYVSTYVLLARLPAA